MPENLERRLSRLIARKRAEAKAARERETKRAQDAAHRDAVAASVAEKWAQDQHLISEMAAYIEGKLAEFGVNLAPAVRPGNGDTLLGLPRSRSLGWMGEIAASRSPFTIKGRCTCPMKRHPVRLFCSDTRNFRSRPRHGPHVESEEVGLSPFL